MRVDVVREVISAKASLPRHSKRDREQDGPDMAAGRTCGIEVVEVGCMKTNQLEFEVDQTALAMYLLKLGPKLPEYAEFGDERLHPCVQR